MNYCDIVDVPWIEPEDYAANDNDDAYIRSRIPFYLRKHQTSRGRRSLSRPPSSGGNWNSLLTLLRSMYGRARFIPLHAFVQGRLCRPWNLIVLKDLVNHFHADAMEKDARGNLPLHLFLQSCMVEKSRAVARGFARDDEDYHVAVEKCFRKFLKAAPQAVWHERRTAMEDPQCTWRLHISSSRVRRHCRTALAREP
jgi:hypothetical protein